MPRCYALLILLLPALCSAQVITGRVIEVYDGDTYTLVKYNDTNRIRMHGIDAPEKDQPYGDSAQATLASLILDQRVSVKITGISYSRIVGETYLEDGTRVGDEMLRRGMAWWYIKYDPRYDARELEDAARAARVGLWAQPAPVSPATWRRRH